MSEISTYDLTAVICHHGTVGGGHYTSFARHESNNKWFEYDDQLVTVVSEEMVQSCEAYVLFYRKSNPKMAEYRAQAMQLLDNCPEKAPSDIRFYVSKQWLNRFNTFAEPGPIDNWALLCPHGALHPSKVAIQSQLLVPVPQPLWEFLFMKFGGGPVCNHLYECDICRRAAEALVRRQQDELNSFKSIKDETTSTLYAISMAWFRQWQIFVHGGDEKDDPGQISNASIAGQQPDDPDTIVWSVRPGSDYAQINSSLWRFFNGVYGGGPTIVIRGLPEEEQNKSAESFETVTVESPIVDPVVPMQTNDSSPSKTPDQAQVNVKPMKIVKNVSFEDDAAISDVVENSSVGSSSVDTLTSNGSATKRHSQYQSLQSASSATKMTDILGKKDKRHRGGITSSGLFGVEGNC